MDPLISLFALIGLATIIYVVTTWMQTTYWTLRFGELPPTSQTYQVDLLNQEVKYLQQRLDREVVLHAETQASSKQTYEELRHDFDQLTDGLVKRIGE